MPTPLTERLRSDGRAVPLRDYEAAGGYRGLGKASELAPREVMDIVTRSGLRGRGGAGFPTGQKWSFVPAQDDGKPRYLVVNADEKEPGTMKDRLLLEGDPHQIIEGLAIAAYAIQATQAFIFLRREYRRAAERLSRAMAEAAEKGYIGPNSRGSGFGLELRLHLSSGRYMCGEETGLLNALEGKRATPRSKPPFPQVSGLWGRPTVVDNVETVANLPHILREGPEWYKSLSSSPDSGTKLYGASGWVNKPGIWEMPMGTTVREILEVKAGGMVEGRVLRGFIPGGASTDFLGADQLDLKLDFDSVAKAGSRLGTGTIVVLDDKTCPVGMVLSLERFFARESCGWCTPCREGLPWIVRSLEALEEGRGESGDIEILEELARKLAPGRTFCAFAPGAVEPLQSALKLFREDFEAHLRRKGCPWK
jgi:NADH-quinone oxidoreductase subunit F